MFIIVLRREDQSLLYMGQWNKKFVVDLTSAPHLHDGFSKSWKLCLNLCSRRSLRPRWSLVRNLIPFGLWYSNTLLGEGVINFRIAFLKFPKVSEFLRLALRLFHSIMVDGKKEFLMEKLRGNYDWFSTVEYLRGSWYCKPGS